MLSSLSRFAHQFREGRRHTGFLLGKLTGMNISDEDILLFYKVPALEVAKVMRPADPQVKAEYLGKLREIFDSVKASREDLRISAVKVAIALLPDSAVLVEELMMRFERPDDNQIHFSFLCYLDETYNIDRGFAERVPAVVRDFLMRVKAAPSEAAWMAGDFLGIHVPPDQGIPALQDVASRGSTATGREAAVVGLGRAMQRLKPDKRESIEAFLRQLSETDRSKSVRQTAEMVLNGIL
jgi:hypothetical protein